MLSTEYMIIRIYTHGLLLFKGNEKSKKVHFGIMNSILLLSMGVGNKRIGLRDLQIPRVYLCGEAQRSKAV